jgi:MinD superfamily P-loop ATPase
MGNILDVNNDEQQSHETSSTKVLMEVTKMFVRKEGHEIVMVDTPAGPAPTVSPVQKYDMAVLYLKASDNQSRKNLKLLKTV